MSEHGSHSSSRSGTGVLSLNNPLYLILPQCVPIVVSIFFSIIPICPQYTVVASIFFIVVPLWVQG